ncbi:unnamed protein product [Brachionus calyciflorus]|uniref:Uncharacterized protein n=1 Tax=Brachionus calyciflorus TaxID=104777 RepID=A0A814A1A1_9BILA|nr:unnamed protein product [Brachionus calyciflorus]
MRPLYNSIICFLFLIVLSVNARSLKNTIDESYLNSFMDTLFKNTNDDSNSDEFQLAKRNLEINSLPSEQYLTESDKKLIKNLIANNFIEKLKNMYAISARSRYGKRSLEENKRKKKQVN